MYGRKGHRLRRSVSRGQERGGVVQVQYQSRHHCDGDTIGVVDM